MFVFVFVFALLVPVLLVFTLVTIPVLAWMAGVRMGSLSTLSAPWAHHKAARNEETKANADNEVFLHDASLCVASIGNRAFVQAQPP